MSGTNPPRTGAQPLGDRAVLLEADDPQRLGRALEQIAPPGLEIVTGLETVLVSAESPLDEQLVLELVAAASSSEHPVARRQHRLRVVLDGEDLDEAMDRTGLSLDDVSLALSTPRLEVAAVGFAPGFGYLTGLSGPLGGLERRPTPRGRVPAGSLAVAAGYAAIYPEATPGGWWLLGHSDAQLFDAGSEEPSLLQAGDTVSLVVVEELGAEQEPPPRGRLVPPPGIAHVLKVAHAPPGCSVVDGGRRGWGGIGVPQGGAFDPDRASLLRTLLGDAPGALEIVVGGLVLDVLVDAVIAGIDLVLELDGRLVPSGVPVAVRAGSQLVVAQVAQGARGYLGLLGGPLIEPVLGSMSTDQLCFVGPGLLEDGDVLGAGVPASKPRSSVSSAVLGVPGRLRVLRGPQSGWLEPGGSLDQVVSVVREPSNRVGLRVEPRDGPLSVEVGALASFPVVSGAIQAPPDGSLVILGPDHATLGGYPVVGCVIGADLGKLGRLAAGDEVTFVEVDLAEARKAWKLHEELMASAGGPRLAGLGDR